jgi:hypothetical protein
MKSSMAYLGMPRHPYTYQEGHVMAEWSKRRNGALFPHAADDPFGDVREKSLKPNAFGRRIGVRREPSMRSHVGDEKSETSQLRTMQCVESRMARVRHAIGRACNI